MAKRRPLSTKILVSNRSALKAKYQAAGVAAIVAAIAELIQADKKRGLATRVLWLDSPSMKTKRVTDPADPVQNKAAIDAIAKKHRPEYLVLLGSHDVIPYQELRNKLHDPADPDSDPDRFALSDLPYACDAPYGQDVTKFLGPTRVVGRLPDLTGAKRSTYLVSLLRAASRAKGMPRPASAFALSAKVWVESTRMSVRNILGTAPVVLTSPTRGPRFAPALLRERVHFVNCHGDLDDPTFEGEGPGETYAKALDARRLAGLRTGTVAAFECCYGAQLYDPRGLPSMSIANRYLGKRAAGVVASTTIAYGPEDSNANADLVCQFFLEQLLKGASLGRALLEARLTYLRQMSVVDPYDEKTLAQFVLLGDPSLHPFPESAGVSGKTLAVQHAARLQRRVRLMKAGERLAGNCAYTVPARKARSSAAGIGSAVSKAARRLFKHLRMFEVREPASDRKLLGKSTGVMRRAKHVFIGTRRRKGPAGAAKSPRLEGFLAYRVNDQTVEIRVVSR